jgi:hypothetical protein
MAMVKGLNLFFNKKQNCMNCIIQFCFKEIYGAGIITVWKKNFKADVCSINYKSGNLLHHSQKKEVKFETSGIKDLRN